MNYEFLLTRKPKGDNGAAVPIMCCHSTLRKCLLYLAGFPGLNNAKDSIEIYSENIGSAGKMLIANN